ncbi:mitochondrial Homoaconitase, partial [Dinochytrium kinnereticum]
PGVTGKDVIVTLCGVFNSDEVLNHAIEFAGPGVSHLTIDDRLTISNMTTEWGALAGVFPVDDVTLSFYESRLLNLGSSHPRINRARLTNLIQSLPPSENSLPPARYAKHITLDLSTVTPKISGPNSVKVATPLNELEDRNIPVHKAYLVSCVNSRWSDLRAAADVFRASGGKVKEGVEFYVAAASSEVQKVAEKTGDWKVLMDAGAKPLPAGCGPCIGLGVGLLKDNEVGISATNRNFKGRMGSRLAAAYLSSPAVVAASALLGKIASPETLLTPNAPRLPYPALDASITIPRAPAVSSVSSAAPPPPIEGFPARHIGELVFCDTDNLDTDGIYAGQYTYQDDMTPPQMAEVVMKNYDPTFAAKVKQGDILVSGFNFGTGSSREQAATSLKYAGVKMIIAGSLSETFKRNAINNGLLCLESPELVQDLRKAFSGTKAASRWTGWKCEVDFVRGRVEVLEGGGDFGGGRTYAVPAVGNAAQELIVAGGLEAWVKQRL